MHAALTWGFMEASFSVGLKTSNRLAKREPPGPKKRPMGPISPGKRKFGAQRALSLVEHPCLPPNPPTQTQHHLKSADNVRAPHSASALHSARPRAPLDRPTSYVRRNPANAPSVPMPHLNAPPTSTPELAVQVSVIRHPPITNACPATRDEALVAWTHSHT